MLYIYESSVTFHVLGFFRSTVSKLCENTLYFLVFLAKILCRLQGAIKDLPKRRIKYTESKQLFLLRKVYNIGFITVHACTEDFIS